MSENDLDSLLTELETLDSTLKEPSQESEKRLLVDATLEHASKKTRRKWTEDDYAMRGLKPQAGKVPLRALVDPDIRNQAIKLAARASIPLGQWFTALIEREVANGS